MDHTIQNINIKDEMERSYIDYSMSVIVSRALPDVRDGFKPVHRRIIYALHQLGFTHQKPHRKSATIVGEVLGKFHPHGDSSIYNAMVRLAQSFATRYPLIDPQGNFGSIDGDGPAAMRYTEARMSVFSQEMLRDIEKKTVDFYPNFDETIDQPEVLPSRFPNLLVNGSTGIAVGMTTSIPPHNLGEIIDATVLLIDNKEASLDEIMDIVKGPDFPTGATILASNAMVKAYRSGRGSVKIRSNATIEEHKGRERIVVTAIPYMLNKSKMLEDIAKLVKTKRIDGITELRDESNREGIRVVMEIRRDASANIILNQLYKYSSMETTFSMIFIALDKGQPRLFNIKQLLEKYIDHQRDVETRRVEFDLEKALARLHIVEGLLKALDHIDEIIKIIRSAYDDAKERLMERFAFSDLQAQSILDMRLRRLQGLEYDKLADEANELRQNITLYRELLADDDKLMAVVKDHLLRIKESFGDERRTTISFDDSSLDIEDLIDEEEMIVTLTKEGYIKRMAQDVYSTQLRGGRGIQALSTKDEDKVQEIITTSTHDHLLFFSNTGRLYRQKAFHVPESSRQSKGIPLVNIIPLDKEEKIQQMISISDFETSHIVIATKMGYINKFRLEDFKSNRRAGIQSISLREGDKMIGVRLVEPGQSILLATKKGKAIHFEADSLRATGRNAQGVKGINLAEDDHVVSLNVIDGQGDILSITEGGYGKRTTIDEYRLQIRGGLGLKNYRINERTGDVVTTLFVQPDDEIMMINSKDIMIRIRVSDISSIGRITSGVHVMNVNDGTKVMSASKVIWIEGRDHGSED